MPVFKYKARDKSGDLKTGEIEAFSEDVAVDILAEKGVVVTGLVPKEEGFTLKRLYRKYSGISLKTLMIFLKQFSVMVNAGLPIVESLKTLAEEETNIKFAEIIADIARKVEAGESLASSMEKYPETFSPVHVNMMKVGETSGKIDEVLLKITEQLERENDLRTKIKGAMIYPSFILVTLVAVALLMFLFVIPRLKPLLEGAGIKLPFLTKVLIFMSAALINWWWIIIPLIILSIFILRFYIKTSEGREIWENVKIRLPVFGVIIKKIYMARFTRTFATLMSGGVNVLQALEISSDAIGNVHYKREIIKISQDVKNGASLGEAFKKSERFFRIVKKMMKVGESTGTLDTTIGKLAVFFESEVENTLNNLSKLLEPILIIIMGIAVALVASSVIMPLYDITKAIK